MQGYSRLAYAFPRVAGIDEVGCNVTQRSEHESAFPHTRVRDREIVGLHTRPVGEEQDVDVQGAWSPTLCSLPRGKFLDLLTAMQQLGGLEVRLDRDDCIEVRILWRSSDRCGLVHA